MIAVAAHIDPIVRDELSAVLGDAGWQVEVVRGADDALEVCRRTHADVLLVGEDIPGGPAELLDRVKRDGELYGTSVVLLSARTDVETVLALLQRGADDILRMPLEPADLVARAFAAARTKALVDELTAQNTRLEQVLFFDELTGLRNRRALMHELEMLLAAARRHGRSLSLIMLDVDRFKTINDHHGHRAGDEVLREVARRLRGRLRTEDVGGRIGGDELLVALPETNASGASVVAESIREAVGESPVPTSAGPIEVTVSVGSACWQGEELPSFLERADRALYAAKAAGRDRTVAA